MRLIHAETRRRGGRTHVAVDDAIQTFLEGNTSEVDEQADRELEQAEIGQHSLRMDGRERFDRLQFHDHQTFDQQIDAKAVVKVQTIEVERARRLPLDV